MSCEEFSADVKEKERHLNFEYKYRVTAALCIRFSLNNYSSFNRKLISCFSKEIKASQLILQAVFLLAYLG